MIETQRLVLLPFIQEDEGSLHHLFTNQFIRKYLWDDQVLLQDQSLDILNTSIDKFENEGWGLWKILLKKSKTNIGFAGLWQFFDEKQPQLLFALLPDFTGKGFATEASRAIIHYAFDELKFDYLVASCDEPNNDSIRVCERLGMHLTEKRMIEGKPVLFFRIDKKAS